MKGWIENKGRKRSPFPKGTKIDVQLRGRGIQYGVESGGPFANDWTIEGIEGDILSYRESKGKQDGEE